VKNPLDTVISCIEGICYARKKIRTINPEMLCGGKEDRCKRSQERMLFVLYRKFFRTFQVQKSLRQRDEKAFRHDEEPAACVIQAAGPFGCS